MRKIEKEMRASVCRSDIIHYNGLLDNRYKSVEVFKFCVEVFIGMYTEDQYDKLTYVTKRVGVRFLPDGTTTRDKLFPVFLLKYEIEDLIEIAENELMELEW